MRISSQNNQFIFQLPVDFMPPYLYEKFQMFLDNNRMPYDNAMDYLNSTIKEINFPGADFPMVTQNIKYGKTVDYKSSKNLFDLYSHDLSILYRSVDSHTNYFMMQEIMQEFYQNTRKLYVPQFALNILDKNGDLIYTVIFKNILLKSIGEIRLSYNKQDFGENTFTLSFTYNYLDILWELKNTSTEESKSIFDLPYDYYARGIYPNPNFENLKLTEKRKSTKREKSSGAEM